MALTTLVNVKAWLALSSTNDDMLLRNLINQLSDAILSYLQRPNVYRATYTEQRNGVGNTVMMMRNWPVVAVSSLQITGQSAGYGGYIAPQSVSGGFITVPAATSFGYTGYSLEPWDGTAAGNPQRLVLNGYFYWRGISNVKIVYQAGYCVQGEAHTIPSAPYQVTPNIPYGAWMQDDGVTYATGGAALTAITSGTPTQGQYLPPQPFALIPTFNYTFAAADTAAGVLINYSYIPPSIEEACIEWVAERYKYKQRIGMQSTALGGQETTTYIVKKMPDHIAQMLMPYQKSLPL